MLTSACECFVLAFSLEAGVCLQTPPWGWWCVGEGDGYGDGDDNSDGDGGGDSDMHVYVY